MRLSLFLLAGLALCVGLLIGLALVMIPYCFGLISWATAGAVILCATTVSMLASLIWAVLYE